MYHHRVVAALKVFPGNAFIKLCLCEDTPGRSHEQGEDFILRRRERDRLAAPAQLTARDIKRQIAHREQIPAAPRPAQLRFDGGGSLIYGELLENGEGAAKCNITSIEIS